MLLQKRHEGAIEFGFVMGRPCPITGSPLRNPKKPRVPRLRGFFFARMPTLRAPSRRDKISQTHNAQEMLLSISGNLHSQEQRKDQREPISTDRVYHHRLASLVPLLGWPRRH